MTLAGRCSITLSSEEAARYVQDGLPQLLASTLRNRMKADYNKYKELIKAIKEEIDENGEDSFARSVPRVLDNDCEQADELATGWRKGQKER
uniref:Uncharacterized protein n=1 Tax=Chromera velia CCMP2878 TaxID=1169474 RepID=A0A0G4HGF4_9ALVE|eukprot:Cvel_27350.t1-p1 / transcript=Cvel_27350.t1 / gene=Cvel_27350 / organism=Chromera_velia_CCMP2878 / gene_product=hypothetical protein / transcript_product=hypothetical protein / location=Cvel_scaffold3396:14598-15724(-) / protein_length=91 / sequence_SO=supercontig / SO=protein_coding / is_pseudo=false